jgi:hypothetical protein
MRLCVFSQMARCVCCVRERVLLCMGEFMGVSSMRFVGGREELQKQTD